MTYPPLSRRSFGFAAGLLGTGVVARAHPAEVVPGDPLRLWADLRGARSGPAGSRRRVEGQMLALDADGRMQRFADVAGVATVRLEPFATGWRVRQEETLDLLDPLSGDAVVVEEAPHGFGEASGGGSEVLTLSTSAGAAARVGADVSGRFVRPLSWPAWMDMPHAPPCLMVGRLLSGTRPGTTGAAGAQG